MKNILKLLSVLLITQLTGCIIFHTVSYEVNVNENGTGTALITIEDINSDSATKEDLDSDLETVFNYGLKSKEFIDEQKKEGINIISRNLIVEKEKLNALVRYEFEDIGRVEGMQFDDPYYFLTIAPEDSIISTNGQVTKTTEYKRIMWDKSMKTLKFKMYSDDTSKEGLKSLTPYFLEKN